MDLGKEDFEEDAVNETQKINYYTSEGNRLQQFPEFTDRSLNSRTQNLQNKF
jgi:hypothetical protein